MDGRNILQQLLEEPEGSGTKLAQVQIAYAVSGHHDGAALIASDVHAFMDGLRCMGAHLE